MVVVLSCHLVRTITSLAQPSYYLECRRDVLDGSPNLVIKIGESLPSAFFITAFSVLVHNLYVPLSTFPAHFVGIMCLISSHTRACARCLCASDVSVNARCLCASCRTPEMLVVGVCVPVRYSWMFVCARCLREIFLCASFSVCDMLCAPEMLGAREV